MQIDFLMTKAKGPAFDRWIATNKRFELHPQNLGIKVNASLLVFGSQHEMV
jgi:hypothetical protein